MLLKCSQTEKKAKVSVNAKQQRATGNMKLTLGGPSLPQRLQRKVVKGFGTKRPLATQPRVLPVVGREEQRTPVDPCDNSNDSGLGFDQHLEFPVVARSTIRFADQEPLWANEHPEVKRKKLEIKLESDDANDNFSFSETMNRAKKDAPDVGGRVPDCMAPSRPASLSRSTGVRSQARPQPRSSNTVMRRPVGPTSLASQLSGMSRDGKAHLQILCQPEQQHRARYQTEGSRGAVKDRSGNGFPVVKLVGYNKPATLQVFIGTDLGRVAPHMFYQACRVSGKNSTPCVEKKIDGTIVIEVDFDPAKDMTITCDCVGILKERNVDVEHRFPEHSGARNKKKSTRCRMVFRTTITLPDGSTEILQTTSQPIVCTQPPGIPEICKKSLMSCTCSGGMELFILGKNFLKDTKVVFQQNDTEPSWEETVEPDKEFLQQTHLVCTVPPYRRCDLVEPVMVRVFVMSSGKTSEPHTFTYMPANNPLLQAAVGSSDIPQPCLTLAQTTVSQANVELNRVFTKSTVPSSGMMLPSSAKPGTGLQSQFVTVDSSQSGDKKDIHPIRLWASSSLVVGGPKQDDHKSRENEQTQILCHKMMPPPPLLPIAARRTSSNAQLLVSEPDPPSVTIDLKTEMVEESSQSTSQLSPESLKGIDLRMKPGTASSPIATVADLLSTQSPSLATFRRFVSDSTDSPLPAQSASSVEKYLSRLENTVTVPKTDSANVSVTSSSSSISDLTLTKIQSNEVVPDGKVIDPPFSSPSLIFESHRQPTDNLTATVQGETQQKVPFANEVTLSTLYSSETSSNLEKQKSHFAGNATFQEAIAAGYAASLNGVVAGTQQKSEFGEPALPVICNSSTLLAIRNSLSNVNEPALNSQLPRGTFQAPAPRTTESSSLSSSTLINNITEPGIIQTATPLIFTSTQPIATKTMLPNVTIVQKRDDQLMDNINKPDQTATVCNILGAMHNSPTVTSSESLNLQTSASSINQHLLAVSQAGSGLMSVSPNSRLEALVTSAIETHILSSDHERRITASEKLNALVNSGADSHMMNECSIPVSSKDTVLSTQASSLTDQDIHSDPNSQHSPIHVQEMRLESSVSPVTAVSSFHINSVNTTQESVQISEDNMINAMSAVAVMSEHILSSGNDTKASHVPSEEDITFRRIGGQNLTVDTSASSTSGNSRLLLESPSCTSPIAVKTMLLNSTVPSVDNPIMVQSPTRTSPIAVKSMILNSPSIENDHLSNANRTSSISMKTIISRSPSREDNIHVSGSNNVSPIAIKSILNSTPVDNDVHLSSSNCTSPIAMKKIILDPSATVVEDMHSNHASPLNVTSILNSQVSDGNLLATSGETSLSTETSKLNVLVQSTLGSHILTTSSDQTTAMNSLSLESTPCTSASIPMNSHSLCTLLSSSRVPTLLADSSQLQQGSLIITQAPSAPATVQHQQSNSVPSIPSSSAQESSNLLGETLQRSNSPSLLPSQIQSPSSALMDEHLTTMFTSNDDDSSVPSLNFGTGNNSTCTVPIVPGESLTSTTHFTTAASNNPNLLTDTSLPSKLIELNGQSRSGDSTGFVNQVLLGLTTSREIKSQIETPIIAESAVPKTVQNNEFLTSSNKVSEGELFEATRNLNSVGSSIQNSLPRIASKLGVSVAKVPHLHHQQQSPQVSPSSTTLPVPVAEISSAISVSKGTTNINTVQKKCEEGMVPQELTQMSDNDLLSYINPSCFDQV